MTHPLPITSAQRTTPVTAVHAAERGREAGVPAHDVAASAEARDAFDGVGSAPPPEVMAQIGRAFDRLEDLRGQGVALRFDAAVAGTGVEVVVGHPDGSRTTRAVTATEAMSIVAGERPALPVDGGPAGPGVDREA